MDNIELTFRFNPLIENIKYQNMIDSLISEGWVYINRSVVGYNNDGEVILIRVHLERELI